MRARILLLAALTVLVVPTAPATATDAGVRSALTTNVRRLLSAVNQMNTSRASVVRTGTRMIRISARARRSIRRQHASSLHGRRARAKALCAFSQFAAGGRSSQPLGCGFMTVADMTAARPLTRGSSNASRLGRCRSPGRATVGEWGLVAR